MTGHSGTENPRKKWDRIDVDLASLELPKGIQKGKTKLTPGGKRKVGFPCRQFNSGSCLYGATCRFEHSCSNCGRMGHGQHICRKAKKVKKEKADDQKTVI